MVCNPRQLAAKVYFITISNALRGITLMSQTFGMVSFPAAADPSLACIGTPLPLNRLFRMTNCRSTDAAGTMQGWQFLYTGSSFCLPHVVNVGGISSNVDSVTLVTTAADGLLICRLPT